MRIAELPRLRLAGLPTPLEEMPRLTQALGGPRIFFKRDDLTALALGGNKARKLEFLMADALVKGADVVITTGGAQSNHARLTAAAARKLGLDCVLLLRRERADDWQGNLLLDHLLGAEVRFTEAREWAELNAETEQVAAELRAKGRRPYPIPVGGANPLGATGYVQCVLELLGQLSELGLNLSHLVVSAGSGGTQAGLVVGAKALGAPFQVVGVSVSQRRERIVGRIVELANETAALLEAGVKVAAEEVTVLDEYLGPGYGISTPESHEALRLVARTEGILLDPVYTAKGMAGLIGQVRRGRLGPQHTVIFLHTGGSPALYAYSRELREAI